MLRIHVSTLTKLTSSGELPSVKVGKRTLILRTAVEAFIRGERVDPLEAPDTGMPDGTPSIFNRKD